MPAHKVHHEMVARICPVCGKAYEAHPVRLRHGRETTCSRACSYVARFDVKRVERTTTACAVCGEQIERTPGQVARPRHLHTCSRACMYAARRSGLLPRIVERPYRRGPAHALWGGGRKYYGASWVAARAACVARDRACRHCGITPAELGRALDVHHVVPFRDFADHLAANDLSNLVALCPRCHSKADAAIRRARKAQRATGALS